MPSLCAALRLKTPPKTAAVRRSEPNAPRHFSCLPPVSRLRRWRGYPGCSTPCVRSAAIISRQADADVAHHASHSVLLSELTWPEHVLAIPAGANRWIATSPRRRSRMMSGASLHCHPSSTSVRNGMR